jgi:hypothetical protein
MKYSIVYPRYWKGNVVLLDDSRLACMWSWTDCEKWSWTLVCLIWYILKIIVLFSDRLLKDIVIETCTQFEVIAFIPLLRERIYVRNAFTRQFIVSWVCIIIINFRLIIVFFFCRCLFLHLYQNSIWCNIYQKLWMVYSIF